MSQIVTYGIGGYDESKPNNNIVEIIEFEDEQVSDVQAIADVLSQLPQETLDAIKQALGIGGNNG
jgi:hypothetical protein